MFDRSIVYELDFKQSWNLVKMSLEEIDTDKNGKTQLSKWTYTTTLKIPDHAYYTLYPDQILTKLVRLHVLCYLLSPISLK